MKMEDKVVKKGRIIKRLKNRHLFVCFIECLMQFIKVVLSSSFFFFSFVWKWHEREKMKTELQIKFFFFTFFLSPHFYKDGWNNVPHVKHIVQMFSLCTLFIQHMLVCFFGFLPGVRSRALSGPFEVVY